MDITGVPIDSLDDKIDELSDLCEYWIKNRKKGRPSRAVREAIVMLADEIIAIKKTRNSKEEG